MITLLFWPCMIASILCSIFGIRYKNHRSLYVAAILIIPMSLYLAGWPIFLFWGLIFPLFYVGSGILIRKKKYTMSFLASVPVYLVIGWLAYAVLNQ